MFAFLPDSFRVPWKKRPNSRSEFIGVVSLGAHVVELNRGKIRLPRDRGKHSALFGRRSRERLRLAENPIPVGG